MVSRRVGVGSDSAQWPLGVVVGAPELRTEQRSQTKISGISFARCEQATSVQTWLGEALQEEEVFEGIGRGCVCGNQPAWCDMVMTRTSSKDGEQPWSEPCQSPIQPTPCVSPDSRRRIAAESRLGDRGSAPFAEIRAARPRRVPVGQDGGERCASHKRPC